MDANFKSFMGFKTPVITEADQILNDILGLIHVDLTNHFNIYDEFKDINEMLNALCISMPEYSFLNEWFNTDGHILIKEIDYQLPDTPEVLDFLDYQKYLVETDEDEQTIRNLVLSITDFFNSTAKFTVLLPEIIFQKTSTKAMLKIKFGTQENHKSESNDYWTCEINVSSASDELAGLLLYA